MATIGAGLVGIGAGVVEAVRAREVEIVCNGLGVVVVVVACWVDEIGGGADDELVVVVIAAAAACVVDVKKVSGLLIITLSLFLAFVVVVKFPVLFITVAVSLFKWPSRNLLKLWLTLSSRASCARTGAIE